MSNVAATSTSAPPSTEIHYEVTDLRYDRVARRADGYVAATVMPATHTLFEQPSQLRFRLPPPSTRTRYSAFTNSTEALSFPRTIEVIRSGALIRFVTPLDPNQRTLVNSYLARHEIDNPSEPSPARPSQAPQPTPRASTMPAAQAWGSRLSLDVAVNAFHALLQKVYKQIVAKPQFASSWRDKIDAQDPSAILGGLNLALLEMIARSDDGFGIPIEGTGLVINAQTCPLDLLPLYEEFVAVGRKIKGYSESQKERLRQFFLNLDDPNNSLEGELSITAGKLTDIALKVSRRRTFLEYLPRDFSAVTSSIPPANPAPAASLANELHAAAPDPQSEILEGIRETLYTALYEVLKDDVNAFVTPDGRIPDIGGLIAEAIVKLLELRATIVPGNGGLSSDYINLAKNGAVSLANCPAALQPLFEKLMQVKRSYQKLTEGSATGEIQVRIDPATGICNLGAVLSWKFQIEQLAKDIANLPGFRQHSPQRLPDIIQAARGR